MEIELKIRIFDNESFTQVLDLFHSLPSSKYIKTITQTNVFIDSTKKELNAQRINFRLRNSLEQPRMLEKSYITIKGKNSGTKKHINDGILCVEELEQEITNEDLARMILEPNTIPNYDYELVKELTESTTIKEYEVVGKFMNKRTIFEWKGLLLECDETDYEFGKAFEIEVEHPEPEIAKQELYFLVIVGKSYL